MLWTIAVSLIIFWLLGLMSGHTTGNFVHIALVVAIIAMLLQVEDDCRDVGSGSVRISHLKKRMVSRSGIILPTPAVLSGEEVLKSANIPQIYR